MATARNGTWLPGAHHHHLELQPLGSKAAQATHPEAHEPSLSAVAHSYGVGKQPRSWHVYLHGEGGWMLALCHIVTAIIGAGVLGLPHAMSWLGWIAGPIVMLSFYAVTLVMSLLQADVHTVNGQRHSSYYGAVLDVLGAGPAAVLVVFQVLNLTLSSTGYAVAAGQSIKILKGSACSRFHSSSCPGGAWEMTIVFGVLQLFLSQLPSLEAAWWSSAVGAAMSVGYSTAAIALCGGQAHNKLGSVWGRAASQTDKVLNSFNALGSVAFAYNFSAVLLEIQDTLHEPPPVLPAMRRAVHGGMGISLSFYTVVSVLGYMALGDATPGDILSGFIEPGWLVAAANAMVLVHMVSAYQVFSQPVFLLMEAGLKNHARCAAAMPPIALRILTRTPYVVASTLVAASVPHFAAISGLAGALVFWPAAVAFPSAMWARVHRPGPAVRRLLLLVNVVAALVSVLAGVGAVHGIIADVRGLNGPAD